MFGSIFLGIMCFIFAMILASSGTKVSEYTKWVFVGMLVSSLVIAAITGLIVLGCGD